MARRKKKTRKTRSDKRKRYNKCKRKKATYEGVKVVLPCRATKLTTAHKAIIDDTYSTPEWNACKRLAKTKKGSCRVVFFSARNPVMRRSDKELKKAVPKATRRRRANAQCRYKSGENKGRFRRC